MTRLSTLPARMRAWTARRGMALVIVAILVTLFAGFAATLMIMSNANSENATTHLLRERALAEANSGLMASIAEITTMKDAATDGWGWLSANYADGSYRVVCEAIANGEYRAISRGVTRDGTVRYVEAVFRPSPPIPSSEAALGFYGHTVDPKDKVRLEIHSHDSTGKEDGAVDDTVHISGIDPNGNPAMPAVGVEDPDAFTTLMERLSEKIADGKVSATSFDGSPIETYTNANGDTVNVPIKEIPMPRLGSDNLDAFRVAVYDTLVNDVIPRADYIVNNHITSDLTLGSAGNPVVAVVDGKDLHVDHGATLTGTGILIITKDWQLHHATINWTGSVIVLGGVGTGSSNAHLQNNHAVMNINGNLLAIAGNNGSVNVHIHNDLKTNDSATHVTGTVMMLAGNDHEKAEFKHHHGAMTIDGFMAVLGQRSKVMIDDHANNKNLRQFNMNGSMVVAVPNTDGKGNEKMEVKLHGNVDIQYDKNKMDAALNGLVGFMNILKLPPQSYMMVSWREMPSVLGDAAMAALAAPAIPNLGQVTMGGGAGTLVPALGGPATGGSGGGTSVGGGNGNGGSGGTGGTGGTGGKGKGSGS